jgi:hypothetical protein
MCVTAPRRICGYGYYPTVGGQPRGELIGLDPDEQDPINGVGGEGSQMVVPGAKRPFLFDLPTFVKMKGGEYLFVPGFKALAGLIEKKF